jgi:hypothetical protein
LDADAARQTTDDFVLNLQHLRTFFVKALRPQVHVGLGIDQLHIDAKTSTIDQNAPLDNVSDAEFLPDLADRY